MWYIQIPTDRSHYSSVDFASKQLLEKQVDAIYDSIANKKDENYKTLNTVVENHIKHHIKMMTASKIDLYVYNYGIDNAIILLNDYDNSNHTVKYSNKSAKSLLFAIFYSMLTITYMPITTICDNERDLSATVVTAIVIIQRFWRKTLYYRKKLKTETIHKDISFLIDKINSEITGEPAKRVLCYLVNKFRRRLDRKLSL